MIFLILYIYKFCTFFLNKVNILNYVDIGHFDNTKIVVKLKNNDVIIKGSDLVISKLMTDEILITGCYTNIEFR